tara:strand:+ start:462 stop:887 length:426 start_codon:yes stop_codon:yes gene_type:complete
MKIYFAGSIRGGREDAKLYEKIINHISLHGEVLTEHVGNDALTQKGENNNPDAFIYERDMAWLSLADIVIAEVSTPSLGVGYELGVAEALKKPVLCLYRQEDKKQLSAMIKGNKFFLCKNYTDLPTAKSIINSFIIKLKHQ